MSESVRTRREAGIRGYNATLAKYGKRRMDAWRRKGGRKRNRTLAEIEAAEKAATGRRKATRDTTPKEGAPTND